jgi:hypothetical protein
MTSHEAREPHVSIPAAELDRLRAEIAECRRLLRKHERADKHPETPGAGWCAECGSPGEHDLGCAWEKAMGE